MKDVFMRWISREGAAASVIFIKKGRWTESKITQKILQMTEKFAVLLAMRGFAIRTQHMTISSMVLVMKLERNVPSHRGIQSAAKMISSARGLMHSYLI